MQKKFKEKALNVEKFLSKFSYELIYTPDDFDIKEYPLIRDKNDLPVLVSAIIADVDIIISGDKDLLTLDIEKPEVLTPKKFLESY
jgi:predicted nucleic acid-binding protein